MTHQLAAVSLQLADIQRLVASDMGQVDALIRGRLHSRVDLIVEVVEHLIAAGGKRLRPMLVILAGRACGGHGQGLHKLATIIEFIHTSTLLHDDVVDESSMRRGRSTANAIWGSLPAVLVGDFLYSRSFQLMVELGSMQIMQIIGKTTNQLAEGEILQLLHVHNPDVDEAAYMQVIKHKTAVLFAASTTAGAILAGADRELQRRMEVFGEHLGYAFQITDDVLDYTADAEQLGKNLGDDLAEGKVTLPLIHAMNFSQGAQRNRLREIVQNGGMDAMDVVMEAIQSTGAVDYSRRRAHEHARIAVSMLGGVATTDSVAALRALAAYAVERSY
ncbi:octaprenyl-diphosphate synthase [Achromobacter pulmonis]|nr:polyprenyl synthetase family protein [Bordetella petrii]PND33699.1 octaprenyl-diphosphate synthase [Achromobacter pulmonis]